MSRSISFSSGKSLVSAAGSFAKEIKCREHFIFFRLYTHYILQYQLVSFSLF